ncbi:S1C family serine protease [Prauserella cavernicola]|uniref:Trypsin-like peptidase domain-containing protein n=1 Tax=Prauserella cavernicola TaxID=2800127 RepID=A0A934QVM3_9PSEU|nr:trypsin-like peptidase domain-containing protein [Prauserella cavernicola]MBK1787350.1 trypsin-like peptidase domain-containing protein [Prauserella cavernicola]
MRTSRRLGRSIFGGVAIVALVASGCTNTAPEQAPTTERGTSSRPAPSTPAPSASAPSATARPAPPPSANGLQSAYVNTVNRVLPSVVQIETGQGLGSGVVYDDSGHIVTNAHVVGDQTRFTVRTAHSSAPLNATLVAASPPDDLAVIKVSGDTSLRPATFGDSQQLRVGDIVLAMGSPLGLSSSVTEGIVSATGRTVTEPAQGGGPGPTIPNTIQTSAAINPGNSGGALVDLAGKVVGIPTLAAVDEQIGGSAVGIGFAIPSSTVTSIADQIIANGKVIHSHRAALGVTVSTVVNDNGAPTGAAIVAVVRGGPAAEAGLRRDDTIVAINRTNITSVADLTTFLAQQQPGDKVTVTYQRSGAEQTVDVVLGELPGG